jgi:hypothetical protein
MGRNTFLCAILGLGLYSVSIDAIAYEHNLTPELIHEAYVLGQRNDQATAAFLAPYIKEFTTLEKDQIHVAQVQLLTPFAQVVDRSRRNTAGYTEQQARAEYEKFTDTVVFNVTLILPAAYRAAQGTAENAYACAETQDVAPEEFWRRFRFRVEQKDRVLPVQSVRGQPIFSAATDSQPAVLDGADVWLQFSAHDTDSADTVVEVVAPECKAIKADFDLKKLR